jgi:hypothetical protein
LKFEFKVALVALLVMLLSLPVLAAEESTPQFHPAAKMAEQINNGQDITRPATRVDVRYQVVNVPGGFHQDVEDVCLETGHIGIYVSSKFQKLFAPQIVKWLAENEQPKKTI